MQVTTVGGFTFGWRVNAGRTPMIGIGVLFMVLGNYLPRIRSNWWMGIRTPWTLESETVWRETHRLGGRTFVVSGAVATLASLLLQPPASVFVTMAALGVGGLVPVVYSYVIWKREHAGRA
jgi:uncharacterized membrane protein